MNAERYTLFPATWKFGIGFVVFIFIYFPIFYSKCLCFLFCEKDKEGNKPEIPGNNVFVA